MTRSGRGLDKLHRPGQLAALLGDQAFRMERGKRPDMGSAAAIVGQLEYAQDIASV